MQGNSYAGLEDKIHLRVFGVDMFGELDDGIENVRRVELLDQQQVARRSGPVQREKRGAGLGALEVARIRPLGEVADATNLASSKLPGRREETSYVGGTALSKRRLDRSY